MDEHKHAKTVPSKGKPVVFSSKHKIRQVDNVCLMIGGRLLHTVKYVRNLGAIMDNGLTMEKQVNETFKFSFYHI